VAELAELARRPGWVTEEPEVHLVPHLRDGNMAGLQLVECQTAGGGPTRKPAESIPRSGDSYLATSGDLNLAADGTSAS
jgi:hypothetical protein